MSQLPPCPQCRSERVWARAALGAFGITHVAFCPGCARAATICGRCGGELVLTRQSSFEASGRPRVEATLQCPTCRQSTGGVQQQAGQRPARPAMTLRSGTGVGATAAPAPAPAAAPVRTPRAFRPDQPAPAVMQRVADDFEDLAAGRYRRRRHLLDLVEEAARRADAMARLDAELARLRH